jgi:hypothetical protein
MLQEQLIFNLHTRQGDEQGVSSTELQVWPALNFGISTPVFQAIITEVKKLWEQLKRESKFNPRT